MTSEEFLNAIEQRQWLSASLMERLQAKIADSGRSFDANKLGKFLVEKGHLTKEQVQELLGDVEQPKSMSPEVDDAPRQQSELMPDEEPGDLMGGLGELSDLSEEHDSLTNEKSRKKKSSTKSSGKGRSRKLQKANEWDSPLLLIGGGALVLLVLCGIVVVYFLFRDSGDELLNQAKTAMQSGSYSQAIADYQKFVEDFPGHPDHAEARINLAMARLRQATEAKNYTYALEVAEDQISAIDGEEKFSIAQGELTALLPRIAQGLATAAETAEEPAKVQEQTELAKAALALCSNTKYIPKSMRGPEIAEVQVTLDRIARRQEALEKLDAALAEMEKANAAGDTRAAYETYETLLKANPELSGDEKLSEMVAKTSQAEQKGIQFVEENVASLKTEAESPVVAALALADRRAKGNSPATGVAAVRVEGNLYALDVASGKLLWRRHVGLSKTPIQPVVVGGDFLCFDTTAQELLRLSQPSGELVWRVPLKEQATQPVVAGKKTFVAGESGNLHVVDLDSGNRLGYVKFAQPLRVPPIADSSGKRLYAAGDHSSLYTLSVDDLTCLGVYYLGHDRGAIAVSPAVVLNKLAVSENDGVETCRLHLFELDSDGVISKHLAEPRLQGLITQQPLVDGRRLIVATDRGHVSVYDITSSADQSALNRIASREPTRRQPSSAVVGLAAGHLWIGDNQLTKYSIDPTNTSITVQNTAENYPNSSFLAPPLAFGDTLVHFRKNRGELSVTVTATNGKTGATYWETSVGLRPAGAPAATKNPRGLLQATAGGKVFLFDQTAISARVQDTPLPVGAAPSTAKPLDARLVLPDGKMLFAAKSSPDVLLFDPTMPNRPLSWSHLPSALACEPTLFGSGWLAPLEIGQVLYLDGAAKPLAAPFQPPLKPGTTRNWLPAVSVDEKQFVVSDGVENVTLVELEPTPQPNLSAAKEAALSATNLTSRLAVVGPKVYAGAKDARLTVFSLPALEAGDPVTLTGEVTWGPYAVGDRVLVATADGKLSAIGADGSSAWRQNVPQPLGPPLPQGDTVSLSFADGKLLKLQMSDGAEVGRIDLKQPLAAAAAKFEQRLAVATDDGAVLIVNLP